MGATAQLSPEPYKLDLAKLPGERKRVLRRQLVIYVISVSVGIYIGTRQSAGSGALAPILVIILGFAAVCTFNIRRALARMEKQYRSYELFVFSDHVIRKQAEKPEIKIRREEVVSIRPVSSSGTMINTAQVGRFIWIPSELIGYQNCMNALAQWQAFDAPSLSMPFMFRPYPQLFLSMALLLAMFLFDEKSIVFTSAILMTALLLFSTIYAFRSPNVSRANRRSLALTVPINLIFVLFRCWRVSNH
jgi:hypothetical protein